VRGDCEEKKERVKVFVRMLGAVVYSHEKQKTDGRFFAVDLISVLRESA
jgi:hypothetical protein